MSTFSGLNTAYRGLTAARQGLDVVGQNIANANTEGYTRQRITTTSVAAPTTVGLSGATVRAGDGVSVDGIARLGDEYLDARVRSTASTAGYWGARTAATTQLESSLREPGAGGLSAQLDEFFSAWQDVANRPGEDAPANVLLQNASGLAARLATGFAEVSEQWTQVRDKTTGLGAELNDAASRIAALNTSIRDATNTGGNVNELVDQRALLTEKVSALAGGTTRTMPDGTVDVFIGGNALVSGSVANRVTVTGANLMSGAAASPPRLEWAARPGTGIPLDGGTIAGSLSALAPANANGNGGTIAEMAESYNTVTTALVAQVNALHSAGATTDGTTGLDFFALRAGVPAAQGLVVVPTGANGIAAGTPGGGAFDGSVADAIGQLTNAAGSPSAIWSKTVTSMGVTARSDIQQSTSAEYTAGATRNLQQSNASVDTDEENVSLLQFQSAYQAAARVLTAVDEMLDTLINRTGLVGR